MKFIRDNYHPDNFWVKLLFLISGLSVTALLSFALSVPNNPILSILVLLLAIPSLFIASFIWTIFLFRYDLLKKIWLKSSRPLSWISFLCAVSSAFLFTYYLIQNISGLIIYVLPQISELIGIGGGGRYDIVYSLFAYSEIFIQLFCVCLGILSILSLYYIWKYILNYAHQTVLKFLSKADTVEKSYLCLMFVISSIAISIIYSMTNVFYLPVDINGIFHSFDVIFCMDTGDLMQQNIYTNIAASSNSSHQFFFGLFAFPFGLLAYIISKIMFFIPNSYYIAISIIQIFALSIITILLSRLLGIKKQTNKIIFISLYSLSFGYLVYSLSLEQYVFSTFWVILFIYLVVNRLPHPAGFYVAAAGSLVSSSILFPLLSNKIDFKKYISVGVAIICLAIVSGKLFSLFYLIPHLGSAISIFGGGYSHSVGDSLLQFINFVYSCIFFDGEVINMSFRNAPVTSLNIFGLIIFGFAILGFLLNYKDKFSQICFGWIMFSFILLGIVGFGTSGNELPLYSLYFGWAFLSLIYLAIHKIFISHPCIQTVILICLLIVLACVNIPGILDMIQFGIQYYPVR